MKMPKKYPCLCQAINTVLICSRFIGVLPIKAVNIKNNHLNTGCTFRISKFWFGVSIFLQIILTLYIITTTVIRIYVGSPDICDQFEWYLMTIGYMIMEADSLISIFFGTANSKRIAKTLERISRLNGSIGEMRIISQQLNQIVIFLFSCYAVSISSFIYVAWIRIGQFDMVTWENMLDSPPGVVIRGFTSIFSQVQCAIVVMMCLLISSKFQHLADTIKSTLEYATFYPSSSGEQTKNVRKIKTSTIKWMATDSDTPNIFHLEHISDQHQETISCLSEINDCFGLQLLVTFTALLFVTVYYLYRTITLNSNDNYASSKHQRLHCIMSLIFQLTKLFLYVAIGQKIHKLSREPAREMQRGKLLCLPVHLQQQIQNLILQWLSIEPCYLSAYNVIKVGPWLLAPIIGNAITYLLVAIQFKITIPSSNTTAIL